MPDYQQGKIYKLISPHTDNIYIGSTTKQYLSQRLTSHKSYYNFFKKGKINRRVSSFVLLDLGDVEIILLESYPCNSKDELEARERYWIEQNKNLIINKNIPTQTVKERNNRNYAINHENLKERSRIYRQQNNQEYKCDCGATIREYNKNNHNKSDKHQTYLMIQTL
jgi:hypothetical protein